MKDLEDSIEHVLLTTRLKDENPGRLTIIPVTTTAQIEEVAVLASIIWHEYFISILSPQQIDYMVEKFQSFPAMEAQMQNQGYQYFMLTENDVLIGYCGIKEEAEEKSLFLSKLYIQKQYREHGYASQAFGFLNELCKEKGYQKIWLTVNRFNENTIKAYEKKGFIKTRTQVADIGNGFMMDDYIMEKIIE